MVAEAETEIAAGRRAPLAGRLRISTSAGYIEQLAFTYDFGYSRLTPTQRSRWEALANQAIFNVWHPNEAKWGSTTHTWSGWSINDPGNNYHFSFLKATMLWAATQNQELLTLLQTQKFTKLIEYYARASGRRLARRARATARRTGTCSTTISIGRRRPDENLALLTPHRATRSTTGCTRPCRRATGSRRSAISRGARSRRFTTITRTWSIRRCC